MVKGGEYRCQADRWADWNGPFYVSTKLHYSPQLVNQTLIWLLLWRYFVDVMEVHTQLTLSNRNYPETSGWACFNQLKGLKSRAEASQKKKLPPRLTASAHALDFLPFLIACPMDFGFAWPVLSVT